MNEESITKNQSQGTGIAKIIYILYLVGIVLGITSFVGVIMAYINRSDAPTWLKTHYHFQIRTFWIGLLYGALGLALAFVFIGYLILLFSLIWLIVRCVKGFKYIENSTAVPNPKTWLF